ncbi:hypothetical protein [Streptomyces sp. NPDC127112]|uniref:hypothetical protein n=1 Tax=Streptomyces sp. NPDC127112 TaxID=3345364 RepID=UPI003643ECBE
MTNTTTKENSMNNLLATTPGAFESGIAIKAGNGFDAPWITPRVPGSTPEEMAANVVAACKALHEAGAIQAVTFLANEFQAGYGPSQPATRPQATVPAGGALAGVGGQALGGGKTCQHGNRTRRTGTNARGEWVAHFCPQPKGSADQCKPIFE